MSEAELRMDFMEGGDAKLAAEEGVELVDLR